MITIEELYGPWIDHPDATPERKAASERFLVHVNDLLDEAAQDGVTVPVNPVTGSQVSGEKYGGFRPQDCPQGAPHSSHKEGRAIDLYDPANKLDAWLDDDTLEAFGLYREAPASTLHWCHLTDRCPSSGHRTFNP